MRGIIEPLNFIQPQLGRMDGFLPMVQCAIYMGKSRICTE